MEMQQEHFAIARRAYELFETRGRENGHDWGRLVRSGMRVAPQ